MHAYEACHLLSLALMLLSDVNGDTLPVSLTLNSSQPYSPVVGYNYEVRVVDQWDDWNRIDYLQCVGNSWLQYLVGWLLMWDSEL